MALDSLIRNFTRDPMAKPELRHPSLRFST